MRIGLRQANQQFSKTIKAVKAGRKVVLTERGKPIAIITPVKPVGSEETAIQQMIDAGLLRPATKKGPLPPFKPIRIKGKSIVKTLREDRDAR